MRDRNVRYAPRPWRPCSPIRRAANNVNSAPAAQPAPAPVVQAPQPICAEPPVRPSQATMTVPPSAPPVLAATNSQPVIPPPAPKLEPPRLKTPSANPPRVELERIEQPLIAPKPEIAQTAALAQPNDDERYRPLGEWESTGAKGAVRIERCGPALCGFALTEASNRGESVLVNMKPKTHDVWTGSIYSRSSGSTYYGTMTLKASGKLHVEACAFGRFWCSGNDWTRIDAPREPLITTSRQWSARS